MGEPDDEVQEAARALGVAFRNPSLLAQALVHRSLPREGEAAWESNERLEFLGDSVLGQIIAEYLYRKYPDWTEGRLTKVKAVAVSEPTLSAVAGRLGLGRFLRMSRGEEHSGGRRRPSILSDGLEAVIGAVFLDQGLEAARDFVLRIFARELEGIETQQQGKDYKTSLQEMTQDRQRVIPAYRVIDEQGPDHDKTFTVEVRVGGEVLGSGMGRSKKEAEQAAAREALETLEPRR